VSFVVPAVLISTLTAPISVAIKMLHDRLRATIVCVTHDQIEAMTLGSKIAVMQGGEIRQFGAPRKSTNVRRICSLPGSSVRLR